jgi:hypothetical protein
VETHEALSWSYYEDQTLPIYLREFKLVCKIKSINYDKIDEKAGVVEFARTKKQ